VVHLSLSYAMAAEAELAAAVCCSKLTWPVCEQANPSSRCLGDPPSRMSARLSTLMVRTHVSNAAFAAGAAVAFLRLRLLYWRMLLLRAKSAKKKADIHWHVSSFRASYGGLSGRSDDCKRNTETRGCPCEPRHVVSSPCWWGIACYIDHIETVSR